MNLLLIVVGLILIGLGVVYKVFFQYTKKQDLASKHVMGEWFLFGIVKGFHRTQTINYYNLIGELFIFLGVILIFIGFIH